MPPHPRPSLAGPIALFLAGLVAGCSPGPAAVSIGPGTVAIELERAPGAPTAAPEGSRARAGHAYFPLTPGRYADFRVRRLGVEATSYVRVTVGRPEPFFGRLASPWVYGPAPGLPVDATLDGLRQYYSLAPDGALWFHGAQNNGFMSHTEPPVRQLPADPKPGAAWVDTVFFESFFPGMIPFYAAHQTYATVLSERAFLDLPGGPVHALRSSVLIDEVSPRGIAIAAAAFAGESFARFAGEEAAPAPVSAAAAARGDRPGLVAKKGLWFARQKGLVARDYPHGPGPDNVNITTYERMGEGFGPVPAAAGAP